VNKGLVDWLSSHDEHVRQRPPPASGSGSATQELERAPASDSRDGRCLDLVEAGALTCAGESGVKRRNRGAPGGADPYPTSNRGVRGLESTEAPSAEKAWESPLSHAGVRRAAMRPGGTRQSAGPKPATRRQARSRRRPDDRKAVRRRWISSNKGASLEEERRSGRRTLAGFPQRTANGLRKRCLRGCS